MWILFAYSGWNASTYIGSEIRDPAKTLPRSLLLGTGIVTVLYILINVVFVYAVPPEEMKGVIAIGGLAMGKLFNRSLGTVFSLLVSFALFSSLSAFIILGPPRVLLHGEGPAVLQGTRGRGPADPGPEPLDRPAGRRLLGDGADGDVRPDPDRDGIRAGDLSAVRRGRGVPAETIGTRERRFPDTRGPRRSTSPPGLHPRRCRFSSGRPSRRLRSRASCWEFRCTCISRERALKGAPSPRLRRPARLPWIGRPKPRWRR